MNLLLAIARRGCALLLVVTMTLQAHAAPDLHDWNRVRSLDSGTELFVTTTAGEKMKGALSDVTADELVLYVYQHGVFRRDRYRRVLRRSEIKQVRLLARELSGVAGAAIGAGVGAGLGVAVDAPYRNHEARSTLALLFGLLGAGLGLAIGRSSGFIKGETIYVAPELQSPRAPEIAEGAPRRNARHHRDCAADCRPYLGALRQRGPEALAVTCASLCWSSS